MPISLQIKAGLVIHTSHFNPNNFTFLLGFQHMTEMNKSLDHWSEKTFESHQLHLGIPTDSCLVLEICSKNQRNLTICKYFTGYVSL